MAGLTPGHLTARGHVATSTNQGSRSDYIAAKPDLHHQLDMCRAPILNFRLLVDTG